MSKKISLSRGLFAIVDDADFDWLSQWNWIALPQGTSGKFKAARNERLNGRLGPQRTILMHRQIMAPNEGEVVDHRNGDSLDNRRRNMRTCTQAENCLNRKNGNGGSSRFKGVSWRTHNRKWAAKFRDKHLGMFSDETEAARAYNRAAVEHGGLIPLNMGVKK